MLNVVDVARIHRWYRQADQQNIRPETGIRTENKKLVYHPSHSFFYPTKFACVQHELIQGYIYLSALQLFLIFLFKLVLGATARLFFNFIDWFSTHPPFGITNYVLVLMEPVGNDTIPCYRKQWSSRNPNDIYKLNLNG